MLTDLFSVGLIVIASAIAVTSQKKDDARIELPRYSLAGNAVNGQLVTFWPAINDYKVACAVPSTGIQQNPNFARLLCQELGFATPTAIKFGQRTFGHSSTTGAVEYASCRSETDTTLRNCTTRFASSSNSCGVTGHIYIACRDLLNVPVTPDEEGKIDLSCRQSRRVLVPRGATAQLGFEASRSELCSITVTAKSGDYFELLSNGSSVPPINSLPPAVPVLCNGSYVAVSQTVAPNRTAIALQRLCWPWSEPQPRQSLYISPMAESVNFTFIRQGVSTPPPINFNLKARTQLSVDCGLPVITISLLKQRLTERFGSLPGTWRAAVCSPADQGPSQCSQEKCQVEQYDPDGTNSVFTFKFVSADCGAVTEPQGNNVTLKLRHGVSITRIFRAKPTSPIEREEQFRLPIVCTMNVADEGASTPVDDTDVMPNKTFTAAIRNPYRMSLCLDANCASFFPATGAVLAHGREFHVQLIGTVPRVASLANGDGLKACHAKRNDGSPPILLATSGISVPAVPVDGKVLRIFRFKVAGTVLPQADHYTMSCAMAYSLRSVAARSSETSSSSVYKRSVEGDLEDDEAWPILPGSEDWRSLELSNTFELN